MVVIIGLISHQLQIAILMSYLDRAKVRISKGLFRT